MSAQQQQQQGAQQAAGEAPVKLRRSLGVWNGVAIIVGVIVGSGIFVSPKGVLEHAGSVGASLAVWALCGLLALLGALCFAELGTCVPRSGGEYTYIRLTYGPLASFLYIWTLVLVTMPCSNAIAALTFANYCLQPLYCDRAAPPEQPVRLLAAAALTLLIYINCRTLSGSMRLQSSFSLAKVVALALIVLYGALHLLRGQPFAALQPLEPGARGEQVSAESAGWWAGTQTSVPQLARAFFSAFFTYSGWNSLNSATEELKRPSRDMPRAIVASITLVTLVYLLANLAYFALLTKSEILHTDAIAVLFGDKVPLLARLGLRWLMPLVVALSTIGGLNASIFAASRVYFAAAREGQLLGALGMLNVHQLTPVPSLLLLGASSLVYLSTTKISSLIEYMTFVEASFSALAVSTMLALRWQQPQLQRPLKVAWPVPALYLLFSVAMLALPLLSSPVEALTGIALTLTGLPVYWFTARWAHKPAGYQRALDRFNRLAQLSTLSVPAE